MVGGGAAAQHWFSGLTYSERGKCLVQADGTQVALRAKSLTVFKYLADQPGTVVNKEDLIAAVWPGVTVTDDSLTQCIADIRRVLGEGAHETLRTVPRQGYVLVPDEPAMESAADDAVVMASAERVGDAGLGNLTRSSIKPSRFLWRSWAAAALLLVIGGVWFSWANWPAETSVVAAPAPHPHAPSLHLVALPTTDPRHQALLSATIGEFRSALARYPTIKLAERTDTDYRLSFSLVTGGDHGARLQVDGVDLKTGGVFMSQSLDVPTGKDAERRLGIRVAAFASPGGGALARHLLETSRHKPAEQLSRAECYAHGYACTTCSGETPSVSKRAKVCLAKILKEDPGDATAWALKSTIHTHQYRWGHGLTEPERSNLQARTHWRDKAVEAANRAESLSNGADTAIYWAMAQAYSATCEVDKLKAVIKRGLTANPNDPSLMAAFGNWLGATGDWEAGAALVERAFELEPEFSIMVDLCHRTKALRPR